MENAIRPVLALSGLLLLALAACGGDFVTGDGGDGGDGPHSGGSAATGGSSSGGGSNGQTGGSSNGQSGGATSIATDCERAADCALISESCCGVCGAPSVDDMIAIRKDQVSAYQDSVCDESTGCPLCAAQPNPNLFAMCDGETCQAKDISTLPVTACKENTDCVVRPRACCPCGAGSEPGTLLAVNKASNSLADYLCDELTACAECEWVPPEGVSAECKEDRCVLQDPRSPF